MRMHVASHMCVMVLLCGWMGALSGQDGPRVQAPTRGTGQDRYTPQPLRPGRAHLRDGEGDSHHQMSLILASKIFVVPSITLIPLRSRLAVSSRLFSHHDGTVSLFWTVVQGRERPAEQQQAPSKTIWTSYLLIFARACIEAERLQPFFARRARARTSQLPSHPPLTIITAREAPSTSTTTKFTRPRQRRRSRRSAVAVEASLAGVADTPLHRRALEA